MIKEKWLQFEDQAEHVPSKMQVCTFEQKVTMKQRSQEKKGIAFSLKKRFKFQFILENVCCNILQQQILINRKCWKFGATLMLACSSYVLESWSHLNAVRQTHKYHQTITNFAVENLDCVFFQFELLTILGTGNFTSNIFQLNSQLNCLEASRLHFLLFLMTKFFISFLVIFND